MEVSEKLLRIRAASGMSQEELVQELGVSFATINRWENGRTQPSKRFCLVIDEYCKEKQISIKDEVNA